MLARLGVDKCHHVGVEGLHELLRTLHESDLHADLAHVLGQLKPDETAARDHCRARMVRIDEILHAERIFHGAQREHVLKPYPRKTWLRGLRTRGEDELVVRFLEHFACYQVLHSNLLRLNIECGHLMVHAHIHVETRAETLGRLKRERLRISDGATNVIR